MKPYRVNSAVLNTFLRWETLQSAKKTSQSTNKPFNLLNTTYLNVVIISLGLREVSASLSIGVTTETITLELEVQGQGSTFLRYAKASYAYSGYVLPLQNFKSIYWNLTCNITRHYWAVTSTKSKCWISQRWWNWICRAVPVLKFTGFFFCQW